MQKDIQSFDVKFLENASNSFWREINPSAKSCISLIKLLEIYASHEEWEKIINLSSRAVLHLTKFYDRADFYHIWICALKETFDHGALVSLGKHLLKMRNYHPVFWSLALLAFQFASCNKISLKIFKYLKKSKGVENRFAFEACGILLSSSKNKENVKKGISIIEKVCQDKKSSYFTWRNYLRKLSENNLIEKMSEAYNLIHDKFPFAQEPYLVAVLISMYEKDWNESLRILGQILRDNPKNTNAILAMADCYLEKGEFIKSLSLLTLKEYLFLDNDFDYHLLIGKSIKYIIESEYDHNLYETSYRHLNKAISIAKSLNLNSSEAEKEIHSLKILNNINTHKESLIDEDNILKIHAENSPIDLEKMYIERKVS